MQFAMVSQDNNGKSISLPPKKYTEPSSQILFLNKVDLFAEKLPLSPLAEYFPDYMGGDNYDAACHYILNRFLSLNQSAATKQIYPHFTCATDARLMRS
jgi:guanine nucleotide-binding protein G(i) subunit alpha